MSKSEDGVEGGFCRSLYSLVLSRVQEERRFIQGLSGSCQVGKTTLARQIASGLEEPVHHVPADETTLQDRAWLAQQEETPARILFDPRGTGCVLFVLKTAYQEFESRAGKVPDARGSKSQLAVAAVQALPTRFSLNDLTRACPGISRELLRKILKDMKKKGAVACIGRGPGALWEKG